MIDKSTMDKIVKAHKVIQTTYYDFANGLIAVYADGIFLTRNVFQEFFKQEDCTTELAESGGIYWHTSYKGSHVFCIEKKENPGWYYNQPIDN